MAKKGIVIDIGFNGVAGIQEFLSEIESQLKDIDFDSMINLSESFDKQLSIVKQDLKSLESEIDRVMRGMSGNNPARTLEDLSKSVSLLENNFKTLMKVMPEDQMAKFSKEASKVTENIDKMSKTAVQAAKTVSQFGESSFKELDLDKTIKKYKELQNIINGFKTSDDFLDLEEPIEGIEKSIEKIRTLEKQLNSTKEGTNKYRDTFIKIGKEIQKINNTGFTPGELFPEDQDVFDRYLKQIEEVKRERSRLNTILKENGVDLTKGVSDKEIKAIAIPVSISEDDKSSLVARLNNLVDEIGKQAEPIKLSVVLVSKYLSNKNQKTLDAIKAQMSDINASNISDETKKSLNKMIEDFDKEFKNQISLGVKVETQKASDGVRDLIKELKEVLREKLVVTPTIDLAEGDLNLVRLQEQLNAISTKLKIDIPTDNLTITNGEESKNATPEEKLLKTVNVLEKSVKTMTKTMSLNELKEFGSMLSQIINYLKASDGEIENNLNKSFQKFFKNVIDDVIKLQSEVNNVGQNITDDAISQLNTIEQKINDFCESAKIKVGEIKFDFSGGQDLDKLSKGNLGKTSYNNLDEDAKSKYSLFEKMLNNKMQHKSNKGYLEQLNVKNPKSLKGGITNKGGYVGDDYSLIFREYPNMNPANGELQSLNTLKNLHKFASEITDGFAPIVSAINNDIISLELQKTAKGKQVDFGKGDWITQSSIDDFKDLVKTIRVLSDFGISSEFIGENLFHDKKNGFTIIDTSTPLTSVEELGNFSNKSANKLFEESAGMIVDRIGHRMTQERFAGKGTWTEKDFSSSRKKMKAVEDEINHLKELNIIGKDERKEFVERYQEENSKSLDIKTESVKVDLTEVIEKLEIISSLLTEINSKELKLGDESFNIKGIENFVEGIEKISTSLNSLRQDFRQAFNLDFVDNQYNKVVESYNQLTRTKKGKISEANSNKKNLNAWAQEYDEYLRISGRPANFTDDQNGQILKKYYEKYKETPVKTKAKTRDIVSLDVGDDISSLEKLKIIISEIYDILSQPISGNNLKTFIQSVYKMGNEKGINSVNNLIDSLTKLQDSVKSLDFSNSSLNEISELLSKSEELANLVKVVEKSGSTDLSRKVSLDTEKTVNTLKTKLATTLNKGYVDSFTVPNLVEQIAEFDPKVFKAFDKDTLDSIVNKVFSAKDVEINAEKINKIKDSLVSAFDAFKNNDFDFGAKNLREAIELASKYKAEFKEASQVASETSVSNAFGKVEKYINDNTAAAKKYRIELERIKDVLESAVNGNTQLTKNDLASLMNNYNVIVSKVESSGKTGASLLDKASERLKLNYANTIAQFASFYDVIRYIRETVQVVTELDTALTELRKVSDASTSELATMFQRASVTAQELGSTVSDVINAQADWSRMGYNLDESDELARVSTIYKNVGDGISQEEANESLISTLQGFKMTADDSMEIIDKFNEVSNNYAISSGGIGEALQRSASSFTAANTDLSKAIALVTTSNTVVQNPEVVGTAFKSMSARLRGATTELEEMGEAEDGVTDTTAKLQSLVKGLTGFDIMEDDKKTFKDIYDIMVGIGEQWDNLTDVEQASLSEALFGKRNSNIGFSILQNIDTLKSVYKTAESSQGSALQEQERYSESIQAHLNQAKASLEELLYTAVDSGMIKDVLDAGKGILDFLTKIIDDFGLLKTLIPAVLGIIGGKTNFLKDFSSITDLKSFIKGDISKYEPDEDLKNVLNYGQQQGYSGLELLKTTSQDNEQVAESIKHLNNEQRAQIQTMDAGSVSVDNYKNRLRETNTLAGKLGTTFKSLGKAIGSAFISAGIGLAIDYIISKLTNLYDAMTITSEEAKNMSEEFSKLTSSIYDNQSENFKKVGELNEEFQKLQSGVGNSGENISLSADQYDRYKEIVNELTDIMPNLSTYFNSQGEAIGFTTGKITDLTSAYEKYIRTQSQMALTEKGEDGHYLYEGVLKNYKDNNQSQRQSFVDSLPGYSFTDDIAKKNMPDQFGYLDGLDLVLKSNNDSFKEFVKNIQSGQNDAFKKDLGIDFKEEVKKIEEDSQQRLKTYMENNSSMSELEQIDFITKAQEEGYDRLRTNINNKRQAIETQLEANSTQIKNLMETYLKSTNDFWDMNEEQRDGATSFINGLDAKTLSNLNIENFIDLTAFSEDVISAFSDINSGVSQAYQELQTMDKSKMSVEDYQKNVDAYKEILKNSLHIDDDAALGIIVKITGVDVESIEENKKAIEEKLGTLNIQGDYKKWTDNLSVGDLELVNTEEFAKALNRVQEESKDNVLTFNELDSALISVKNSAQETKTAVESLSDINKRVDSLGSLYDKYEQNGYLEQSDVADILEANPEYYKYLIKVGDQYKLNMQSYNEWSDAVNDQQATIDNMLGGFGYLNEVQENLQTISNDNLNSTYTYASALNDLLNQNKVLNEQMINGEINSTQYIEGLKNQIGSLNSQLRETNGQFDISTDYLEEMTSFQLTELAGGLQQVYNQYLNGSISTLDTLKAMKSTLEASAGAYNSLYGVELTEKQYGYNTIDKPTEIQNEPIGVDLKVNNAGIKNAEDDLSGLERISKVVGSAMSGNFDEAWGAIKGAFKSGSDDAKEDVEEIKNTSSEAMKQLSQVDAVIPLAELLENSMGLLGQFEDEMGNFTGFDESVLSTQPFIDYATSIKSIYSDLVASGQINTQILAESLMQIPGVAQGNVMAVVDAAAQGNVELFNIALAGLGNEIDVANALTSNAQMQVAAVMGNTSLAISNVLSKLADVVKSFDFTIKPEGSMTITPSGSLLTSALFGTPYSLTPSGSITIKGEGGDSIKGLGDALGVAAASFGAKGAQEISQRALNLDSYSPAGTSRMATPAPFRPSYDGGSGGGGGGGSDGGSGGGGSDGGGLSDDIDEAQEKMDSCTTIDHFETKIKRLEREIENLDKIASHTFIGWQERNNKLGDSFWKLSNELQAQCSGMWMYLDKANSVPLDDFHKNLVNNGCTSIETFADDNLKNLIDEYQEWYEKALDCADAIEEIRDKQAEVFSQQFDNVGKQYDQLIERVELANEKLDLWIENQETRGKFVANSYYATQIDNEKKRFMNLQEQLKKQQDLMSCSVNQGAVQLFSEQWYEMNNAIMETDNELQKTINTIDELNNKMRENNWDIFDKKMEWKEMLEEESNFLIDALSRDELYNENGTFNEGGISVAGMRAVNFDYNMARAQDYKKAIAEVEAEMKRLDYTDQNLVDRRNELLKLQQDSIKAALDEKDAIKDLVKEGYDKLVSYLDKLTGKYKQTLRAQKDLYDYEKSIRKQTEAISDYSKQLMALEGDDSEENKARLQQLRQNLKDAEEELEDTEYNKWLEDQESMLDDMMSDLEEWIEEKLTHTDEIIQEQINAINDSKDVISKTINDKVDDLGYSLTEAMDGIINNNCTAYDLASDFHGEFTNEWNRTLDYLKSIDKTVDEMRSRTCTESSDNRGCTSMVNNGVANNGCSSADQNQSWTDMKPLNPQPQSNECTSQQPQNNGCTPQPQNNGCSQPQNNGCTQPQNNGCSQQQNNACTPQNDDCTRNNSCSNYATGRRKGNKELAWTQEKGQEAIYRKSDGALLTPLGNGDKVFTNAQTEALWNMSKGLNPTALPSVAKVNNSVKTGDSNVVFEGDINVVGVTNPREFSEQLRNAINNDEKVKKTLQANTLGVAVGKNSLLGNSIK